MIGQLVTDKNGNPVDSKGNKLAESAYQPSDEVKKLFAQVQADYQVAWTLQHRPFDEFDGYSLLDRTRMDQKTFGAFVGAEYIPQHKQWRWKGRKQTARNKMIGILANMLSAMLFPFVQASNDKGEEDKLTARVMRILVENHLRKANYELKFLFMVTSALVCPAVFTEVRYVEALQKIKIKDEDGKYRIEEAVDEILSGINLDIVPIDQILLGDFYTFDIQRQPYIVRVQRISYDEARSIYAGLYKDENGVDLFDYVEAGKTRIVQAGQENQTLYDIEWTEADREFVQVITAYYRGEDLQVTFVGGVFMGNQEDVYNSNPFSHRRFTLVNDEWQSVPIYPFAKSGYEPLDPSGRFAYYKSAAFKEFWDDMAQNKMFGLMYDGTYLDVIKPTIISGLTKVDSTVIIPGATIGVPQGAQVTPYSTGTNLAATYNAMAKAEADMSESTQDKIQSGILEKGVTAYATEKAIQQAKKNLTVFGAMVADLVRQVGELVSDCIIMHETVGTIDATVPESLKMKYKTIIARGKDSGKDVTNKIVFKSDMIGNESPERIKERNWEIFEEEGGMETDQRRYEVNPYKFARHKYSFYIDPDIITTHAVGQARSEKLLAFQMLTDPRVAPFTDQQAVVEDFVIEEFSEGDPDRYKKKQAPGSPNDLLMGALDMANVGNGTSQPQGLNSEVGQLPANPMIA